VKQTANSNEAINTTAQSKERSVSVSFRRGRYIECGKCGLVVIGDDDRCCTRCGVLLQNWGIPSARRVRLTESPQAPKRFPLAWAGLLVATVVLAGLFGPDLWALVPNSVSAPSLQTSPPARGTSAAAASTDLDAPGAAAALMKASRGNGVWGTAGSGMQMIAIRVYGDTDTATSKYMVRSRQHKTERWSEGTPYRTPDAAIRAIGSGGIHSFGTWINDRAAE